MQIGSLNLSSSSAVATSSYEYYKSEGGEIIGGVRNIKINGSVVVEDTGGQTGSLVMSQLSQIVALGKEPKCLDVDIPGQYSGKAKIQNISINQGSDPTWINKGDFGIELQAPLDSIPANSLGITAADRVVEFSRYSKIELSEDSHGYLYSGAFHKTFATLVLELNIRCEPLCSDNLDISATISKLISNELNKNLGMFSSWNKYAKSRSIQMSSNNSAVINTQYIITPHNALGFADLKFDYNRTYGDNDSTKKTISGSITGLTNESIFTTNNGFTDTCSDSKITNAQEVFDKIKAQFTTIQNWEGIKLDLIEQDNPFVNTPSLSKPNKCIKPSLSTVTKSRTEGIIDFTFEWSTDDNENCADSNGISKDVVVDIIEPQKQFVEHVIPSRGTLIQDLNTKNARRINIQTTTTYPEDICGTMPPMCEDDSDNILRQYNISGLLIKHTIITSKRSVVEDKSYIEC